MRELVTQVDRFVINTEARMLAVIRSAVSDVIEEAQTPVAKGGRMRVKTGFLRASGVASLNTLPSGAGEGDRKAPDNFYKWKTDSVQLVLSRLKIGDVFYFGWTARYAKIREAYDGFLETAIQKWQTHVDAAVKTIKQGSMK